MKKLKAKISVNNKMKPYGTTDTSSGKVQINVKKHAGSRRQLADTIKHELIHVKHPKMHEKTVYKLTKPELSKKEEDKLIAKLREKKMNYQTGALKRTLKMKADEKLEPGSLISKMNEMKGINRTKQISKERLSILGLI